MFQLQSGWMGKKARKKKLVKSHDRISGPRSIDSFRKCPMEGTMHRKGALCHSKSDLMSLEKQVGVYICTLLSVLFYGSHTANVASSKSPMGKNLPIGEGCTILSSPHSHVWDSHHCCCSWGQEQRPTSIEHLLLDLASEDEWVRFLTGGAHSLAGTLRGQTLRKNRPQRPSDCPSSLLRQGIRPQGLPRMEK